MKDFKIDKTGWKKVTFGEICRQVNENVKDPVGKGVEYVIGLEHIEPNNLHITRWDTLEKGTTFTRKFKKGQVLFGRRRAYQRKVAYAEFDGICSGDILVFEAIEEKLISRLLPFIVQSEGFFSKALATSAGSLSPRTKFKELADYELLLPDSKEEQSRLAELLWTADEVVEREKGILMKLINLRNGLFEKYLRRFNKKYVEALFTLEDLCDISGGSTPLTTEKKFWGKGYYWLTPVELTNKKNFEILQTTNTITKLGLKAISGRLYPSGTVMLTTRATIGNIGINLTPMATNQGFTNFVCGDRLYNMYLLYTMIFNLEYLKKLATGSTFLEISKASFRQLKISLPDINTQKNICKEIQNVYDKLQEIDIQYHYSIDMKQNLINQIF